MHYLLFYDVVPGYTERRAAFRAEHLAYARRAHERGDLVLGGAPADPVAGATLLSLGRSMAAVDAFATAASMLNGRRAVTPSQPPVLRRDQDRRADHSTTSGVVQEHLLRGGGRGRAACHSPKASSGRAGSRPRTRPRGRESSGTTRRPLAGRRPAPQRALVDTLSTMVKSTRDHARTHIGPATAGIRLSRGSRIRGQSASWREVRRDGQLRGGTPA
jgi:hypothetical protein